MSPVVRASPLLALILGLDCAAPAAVARDPWPPIPRPQAAHPGNLFLEGDEPVVPLPADPAGGWQLLDHLDRPLREVIPVDGKERGGVREGPIPEPPISRFLFASF